MLPTVGSVGLFGQGGRLGVVVDSRPLGEARDGKQSALVRVRHLDGAAAVASQPQPVGPTEVGGARAVQPAVRGGRLDRLDYAAAEAAARAAAPSAADAREAGIAAEGPDGLTSGERAAVDALRQRDAQVRQEEKAHAAVAGDLAGPIQYSYQTGPDGRRYAVGGSVSLKSVSTSDPEEAKRLGARMAAAAQAATNPSAADLSAARDAYRLAARGADLAEPERPGVAFDLDA